MMKNVEPLQTIDDLRIGGFFLIQPQKGYRFSLDAPLLAALVPLDGVRTVLDMGCGSGVLPLLLLGRNPALRVTGIECMEEALSYAEKNRKYNHVDFELICGDAMDSAVLPKWKKFDLIVSNPPYYKTDGGRLPQNENIAAAKTELFWHQPTMMKQAFGALRLGGRFSLIFAGHRGDELIDYAKAAGFVLEKRLDIFAKTGGHGANRVYLQFRKGIPCSEEHGTLYMYEENGEMTPKMKRILEIYHGTGTVSCGNSHW